MNDLEHLSGAVLNLALALPRPAAAFLVLPLFSQDSIPPLVRNIFLVSITISIFPLLAPELMAADVQGIAYGPLVLKEILIGAAIGYAFSILFWALEGAGQVIDNKVGATTAQLVDPLSGHQTSPMGAFFARLAAYLFVAFGGLGVFIELVLTSYTVWPVTRPLPQLDALGHVFFVARFDDLMRIVLLFSAPVLVLLTLIDVAFGFVNRYAQQLNVFSVSMPVKAWLATLIVFLMLGVMAESTLDWIDAQRDLLNDLEPAL